MRRTTSFDRSLWIAIPLLALSGCAEHDPLTPDSEPDAAREVTAMASASGNAAVVQSGTFAGPFPPNPAVPFVPVPAPCLGLGEPLHMSGVWSGRFRAVETSTGRVHFTEKIDWSGVAITLGGLTWLAAPGAQEIIVENVPATADDLGDAAFVVRHQFNNRFISQDGLPDLRVGHSIKELLGPDLELRHEEFVPFTAACIGGGA